MSTDAPNRTRLPGTATPVPRLRVNWRKEGEKQQPSCKIGSSGALLLVPGRLKIVYHPLTMSVLPCLA